jgi:hypothetical protein
MEFRDCVISVQYTRKCRKKPLYGPLCARFCGAPAGGFAGIGGIQKTLFKAAAIC